MTRRAFSVYRSNMSPLPPSSPVSCRVSDKPHTLENPLGPYIIMQSRYQRTQVPKGTPVHDTPHPTAVSLQQSIQQLASCRTCPSIGPDCAGKCPKSVTPYCSTPTLTPKRFRAPPLRHAHDAAAARDDSGGHSEIERGYQEIFCDTYFQPLSFKSRSESASRGANPPGAANTILRKSFVKKSQ